MHGNQFCNARIFVHPRMNNMPFEATYPGFFKSLWNIQAMSSCRHVRWRQHWHHWIRNLYAFLILDHLKLAKIDLVMFRAVWPVVHFTVAGTRTVWSCDGSSSQRKQKKRIKLTIPFKIKCTRWRSLLRHCATSRKIAGSFPAGVIFHWHNPSGRTMVLGLTQTLTEISTRNISWG
jgi:hypothetical protein